MADTPHSPAPADDHAHHGPKVQSYLVVGGALAVFTIVSFVVSGLVQRGMPGEIGFMIILTVAVVKATLVVAYFMHVIWDWRKVGFMIVPALILGAMWWIVM